MALPLRVTVAPDHLELAPGDTADLTVTVRNASEVVEHYEIEVLGLPANGTAVAEPPLIKLRPTETGTATVRITVPADPPAPAGSYTLGVVVRSHYRAELSRCEEVTCSIAPLHQIGVQVEPEVATGGRAAQYVAEVVNGGNVGVRLLLTATDPERRVAAAFDPPVLELPPGGGARALLSVRAPVPWNREVRRALTVGAAGPGAAGEANATFVQKPRLPSGVLRTVGMVAAVAVLAGAVVAAALVARRGDSPKDTAGTPQSSQTASAPSPPSVTTTQPSSAATTPTTTAPSTTSAEPPPPPPAPVEVDLAHPSGIQPGQLVPSDAFDGILLSGLPGDNTPANCADATAVVLQSSPEDVRYLTAARPDDLTACHDVPVQIRFLQPPVSARVALAEQAVPGTHRLRVEYRDLSSSTSPTLEVHDGAAHSGIDTITVEAVATNTGEAAPPTAVQGVRYTLAAG